MKHSLKYYSPTLIGVLLVISCAEIVKPTSAHPEEGGARFIASTGNCNSNGISISTEAEFNGIQSNKNYKLLKDIVFSAPLSTPASISNVCLDGNGFALKNVQTNVSDGASAIFPKVVRMAIKNLRIEGAIVRGGGTYAGLLVGRAFGLSIKNVQATGVSFEGSCNYCGGLVGASENGGLDIQRSSLKGQVNTPENVSAASVGGLVALVRPKANIHNSYFEGDVNRSTTAIGAGLIGQVVGFTQVGGEGDKKVRIINSYAVDNVNPNGLIQSVVQVLNGLPPKVLVTNSYWDKLGTNPSGTFYGTPKTTQEMFTAATFVGWNFTNIWNPPNNNYPTLK